ncbi:MAG: hypothetical protein AAGG44_04770 [Planctomycetota bacterium]
MNVFAPDEPKLLNEAPAERTLWIRAKNAYAMAPDLGLFAAIALMNVLVFGPIAGNLWTPSRILQLPVLRAYPVSFYTPLDSFALALTTIQLALVSVWVVFSSRTAIVRGILAFCVLITFGVTLAVTHNTSWGLTGIGAVLMVFSGGVMAASICLATQGWQPTFPSAGEPSQIEGKQFGLSELMILSAVVGVGCVVVGWFMNIVGRNPLEVFGYILFQREIQLRLMCIGFLGFTSYWLLPSTNPERPSEWFRLLTRIILIAISGAGILYVQVWLYNNVWFGGTFRFATILGDSLFFLLHTAGLAAAFVVARKLGIHFVRRPQDNKFRWIAEIAKSKVLRLLALGCLIWGSIWVATWLPSLWANYQLQAAVRPYGSIFNQRSALGYTLYMKRSLDTDAFEILSEHPMVSNLVIGEGNQVDEETFQLLKKLTWLSSVTIYQSQLSSEQVQELQQALPSTGVRAIP